MHQKAQNLVDFPKSVCNFIVRQIQKFKGNCYSIKPESLLQEELNLSSLEMISLLTDICEEFDIDITSISDVDLAKMKKVVDITDILTSKK